MIPRPFRGADDLFQLQALIARLNEGGYDYVHPGDVPHRLYNGLRRYDNLADLVWVWEDEGVIRGFTVLDPRAKVYEVHVDQQLSVEAETEVFRWSETQMRARVEGDFQVWVDVLEDDPRRTQLLEALGYQNEGHVMTMTIRDLAEPLPPAILPAGFTVRAAAGDHEAGALAAVHHGAFGSQWTEEQYRKLMHTPGYAAERELVVVAPDGEFAAFCIYWMDHHNKTALFEPVGTHADFQRRGLARALMIKTMHRMIAQGMKFALVIHETNNAASAGLYAGLGFQPRHHLLNYMKSIKTDS